jgi:hypothetical protein
MEVRMTQEPIHSLVRMFDRRLAAQGLADPGQRQPPPTGDRVDGRPQHSSACGMNRPTGYPQGTLEHRDDWHGVIPPEVGAPQETITGPGMSSFI